MESKFWFLITQYRKAETNKKKDMIARIGGKLIAEIDNDTTTEPGLMRFLFREIAENDVFLANYAFTRCLLP